MTQNLACGIEIGGTKLQVALGGPDGNIHAQARETIEPRDGAQGILKSIQTLFSQVCNQAGAEPSQIKGIGVGFGGPVNPASGHTVCSHQIDGWDHYPLRQYLEERFSLPAKIQNDASLAGYAEAHAGAGQGYDRLFYITIGSGIGGGFILNGEIDEGQGLGAAEIGHTYVPDPETGEPEKLEHLCSGWSIGQRAREALLDGEDSTLRQLCNNDIERIDARMVYQAAEQEDILALTLLDETTRTLAVAISNVIALYSPRRVIIGGGVSLMGPLFWEPLQEKINYYIFDPFRNHVDVVPAQLSEDVVIVGGVLLGHQTAKRES